MDRETSKLEARNPKFETISNDQNSKQLFNWNALNSLKFAPPPFPSPRRGEGGVRGNEPNVKIVSA